MRGLVPVCEGKRYRVWMTAKVARVFRGLKRDKARYRARCLTWMGRFADDGSEHLIDTQFKSEGRFGLGDRKGTKVQVFVFKAFQLRVYGAIWPETNCFICTEIDEAKKQDTANQHVLRRAATNLGDLMRAKGEIV